MAAVLATTEAWRPDPRDVFDEAMRTVRANFYDRSLRGLPWDAMAAEARATLRQEDDEEKVKETVNGLLARLRASHTELYSDGDQTYWALKSIFSRKLRGAGVRQVGLWFERRGEKWFVRNVFAGSSGSNAGVLPGDEVAGVDGEPFEPVRAFRTLRAALGVRLDIRRKPDLPAEPIHVETRFESFQETMLAATRRSFRVIPRKGRKIAYFHLWSGTHPLFLEALQRAAAEARKADALVLDLRDGFGGAHPDYVAPFEDLTAGDSPLPRGHKFRKPLVVLINGGTRSGKEWVAYLLARAGRTLVGTRTRGAFLGGRPYTLGGGKYLLYLAVAGAGPEGVDLEGSGVPPDVEVAFELPYSAGADPQLERALDLAAEQATGRVSRSFPHR
ncbi:MAG: hypothetical protein FJZ01_23125 [Candidatus Sericytochromatia bacterium]|nr:hypothetical protein [Candidatus Tanganyikabacteria bacterium]